MTNKSPNKSPKPQSDHPKTLSGDIKRVVSSRGARNAGAWALALGLTLGAADGVQHELAGNTAQSQEVCVPNGTKPFSGTEFGGTVSGLSKAELDSAIAAGEKQGVIDPAKVSKEKYQQALGVLTDETGVELGTNALDSGKTYELPKDFGVCAVQLADGSLSVEVRKLPPQ